jgi:outer membrane protein assembly factor BamB
MGRMPSVLNIVTGDGMLHTIYVSNGEPQEPPVRLAPSGSNLRGRMAADGVVYAAAASGCDAPPAALVAYNLESKQTAEYRAAAGAIAGDLGPALGPEGMVYAATTGGELVALEAKTLKPRGSYKAGGAFVSSPVVFELKGKTVVAAATKDGRIHLVDENAAALAQSAAGGTPVSALASWQDAAGARYVLGAGTGAVVAWKVVERNGGPALEAAWTSRDVAAPLAPIVVNGVAFTASTGAAPVLYALDASTGKELWNSGRKIGGAMHGGGLSAGNTQVYLGADDGTLYAFGFPIEH